MPFAVLIIERRIQRLAHACARRCGCYPTSRTWPMTSEVTSVATSRPT